MLVFKRMICQILFILNTCLPHLLDRLFEFETKRRDTLRKYMPVTGNHLFALIFGFL